MTVDASLEHIGSCPRLPYDVLLQVAEHLSHLCDTLAFSLASKSVYAVLAPVRYRYVEVKGTKRCVSQLEYLLKHPEYARHITTLVLRPNYLLYPSLKHIKEEMEVASALELLAPNLHSLQKFIWDGVENISDNKWMVLRNCCQRLRYVGTNVGLKPISPSSEFFKFQDLLGFQLTSKGRHPPFFGECEDLPREMWDMLIHRCPDLREIIIGHRDSAPCSDRTFNLLPITEARHTWRNLHTMILSNGVLFPMFELNRDEERQAESAFSSLIAAHPTLRRINLMRFRHLVLPSSEEDVLGSTKLNAPCQLPHVSSFDDYFEESALSTNYAFVRFHPSWNIVYEIDLCNIAVKPWMFRVLRNILRNHKALRVFGVWADLTSPSKGSRLHILADKTEYEFATVLRSFIKTSKNLEHLKFRCSSDTKVKKASWSCIPAIVRGTTLRSLEVCKPCGVFSFTPERNVVRQMVTSCPTLERIGFMMTLPDASLSIHEHVGVAFDCVYSVRHERLTGKDGFTYVRPVRIHGDEKAGDVPLARSATTRCVIELTKKRPYWRTTQTG